MDSGLADLHVHTTASDGRLTPQEVVIEAAHVGLAAIGIADHDTVDGLPAALEAGREAGIRVVPGVEINTDYGQSEVHILGYYIDYESTVFTKRLVALREGRYERVRKMVEKLNEIGVKVDLKRVEEIAGDAPLGRPHVARAIVEAGYAGGMNGAFGKYIVRGAAAYVPRSKLSPEEAVQIVRSANGVPVMAHPGHSKHDELIPVLVEAGLQGLEAYHTDHSSAQRRHYQKLAKKYNLLVTGGSDYHGPDMLKMVPIGHVTVGIEVVDRLQELSNENRTQGGGVK